MSREQRQGNELVSLADLDAAYNAANDCLEANAFARAFLWPDGWPSMPPAFIQEAVAHAIQNLTEALERLPMVEKVQHLLVTRPDGLVFPGVGRAPTAHWAAFLLAKWTRWHIWTGLGQALHDDLSRLFNAVSALAAAQKKIDKVDKALCDEHNAVLVIFQQWAKRNADPQTVEEVAALWRPSSLEAIQRALGNPLEIDDIALATAVECEYLQAKRAAAGAATGPRTRLLIDLTTNSATLDTERFEDQDHDGLLVLKAVADAAPKRVSRSQVELTCELTRPDRHLSKLCPALRLLVDSGKGKAGYLLVLPALPADLGR